MIHLKLKSCAVGKLPASQASPEVVSAYRIEEKEDTKRLLEKYLSLCRAAKVCMHVFACVCVLFVKMLVFVRMLVGRKRVFH